jgi:hypothetical protein
MRSRPGHRSHRPSASSRLRNEQRELLGLRLPAALASVPAPADTPTAERALDAGAAPPSADGGPVEFDRVVPAVGEPGGDAPAVLARRAARAGQTVRFWAGVDVIHLSVAGARIKSLRSHLSVADLAQLA